MFMRGVNVAEYSQLAKHPVVKEVAHMRDPCSEHDEGPITSTVLMLNWQHCCDFTLLPS